MGFFPSLLLPPDSMSYWGSYFNYRKSCRCAFLNLAAGAAAGVCVLELGCWCRCRVLLLCAAARCCVHLGARVVVLLLQGAAASRVRFGAWVLVPLPCVAARLRAVVPLGRTAECRGSVLPTNVVLLCGAYPGVILPIGFLMS